MKESKIVTPSAEWGNLMCFYLKYFQTVEMLGMAQAADRWNSIADVFKREFLNDEDYMWVKNFKYKVRFSDADVDRWHKLQSKLVEMIEIKYFGELDKLEARFNRIRKIHGLGPISRHKMMA